MESVGSRFNYPIAFALLALVILLGFMLGIWRKEEAELRSDLLSTSLSIAELAERHFREHEEMQAAFAFEVGRLQKKDFMEQTADFVNRHPDVESLSWLTPALDTMFHYPGEEGHPEPGSVLETLVPLPVRRAFGTGRTATFYTPAVVTASERPIFFAICPVFGNDGALGGYVVTGSRVDPLMDLILPASVVEGYALELVLDRDRKYTLEDSGAPRDPELFADIALEPSRLVLHITRYEEARLSGVLTLSAIFVFLFMGASGWQMVRIRRAVKEKHATEVALVESEERYRTLFSKSLSVMLLVDPESGRIEDANPAALKYYGYSLEDLRDRKISDINTLGHEDVLREIEKARAEKRNYFRFHHRLASGETRDVEVFSGPVTIKGREFLFSIIHDVTERTRLQEELDRTLALQARILENAFVGILYIRRQKIVWANPVAGSLFGHPHERLVGLAPEEFLGSSEEVQGIRERAMPVLESGKPFQVEMCITRKDGAPLWLDIFAKSATPTGLEEGSIWVVRDVSARKGAEERLQASLTEKEVLLREIHHRVKNNFQVVLSLLNLKTRQLGDTPVAEVLQDLSHQIRAMSSVHERLYRSPNMAAIDSGAYLASMARDVIRTARPGSKVTLETRIEAHPLSVEMAIPCGLMLTELLVNVLRHAYPESREGIARVRFSKEKTGQGNEVFCLEVSDEGRGMGGDSSSHKGSLGLSLVHTLAEKQLGGVFRVEGPPGTRCVLTFPASPVVSGKTGSVFETAPHQEVSS